MLQSWILFSIAALPFLGCALVLAIKRWGALINIAGAVATCGLLSLLYQPVLDKECPQFFFFTPLPDVPFSFSLEPLGFLFACLVCVLWGISSLYCLFYMEGHEDPHLPRFYSLLSLSIGCTLGVAFASNLLTLFFFYEALTLSTAMLVAHKQDHPSVAAAKVYLFTLVGASLLLLLPAIVITGMHAHTLEFKQGGILSPMSQSSGIILLLMYTFGLAKLAVMPVHGWLKRAMVAPSPVSALLHAVAVVKAGAFSLLKIGIYVFGLDMLRSLNTSYWLTAIASISLLAASVLALEEELIKGRLAYSTISQLSYILLGLSLASSAGVFGAILQMMAHAFAKITLFMGAGTMEHLYRVRSIKGMSGLGRKMPWTLGAFFAASLAIVGLPLFGNFWAKNFLISGAVGNGSMTVLIVLLGGTMLSAAYLLPLSVRAFFAGSGLPEKQGHQEKEPLLAIIPPLLTVALAVLLFFFVYPVLGVLGGIALGGEG